MMLHLSRCNHPDCTKQPSFAMPGHSATFCGAHKQPGMIDVKHSKCKEPGCTVQPG